MKTADVAQRTLHVKKEMVIATITRTVQDYWFVVPIIVHGAMEMIAVQVVVLLVMIKAGIHEEFLNQN